MKKKHAVMTTMAFFIVLVFTANAMADGVNIPITADQTFDAVIQQVDPASGKPARVALIDVRTTAEYYWVGACGKVESILTESGKEYFPYDGKVELKWDKFLYFMSKAGRHFRPKLLPIKEVKKVVTTDISIHIPTHTWDEAGCKNVANPDFAAQIESLSEAYDVIILMCRSGQRSNTRAFDTTLFAAIYELDQPNGVDGHGGFQGSSYGDKYNGYRGYPGRDKHSKSTQTVSWSDAGLPVHIGWTPFAPDF